MATISTVGVCGLGLMGSGIAQVSAQAGYRTVVREVSRELLDRGVNGIRSFLDKGIEKGKITAAERDRILGNLVPTLRFDDLGDCDLIVEAIVESREDKRNLFTTLDTTCKESAIFATNTSSLSVTDLAAATDRKDRFCGLHFFNPVPLMKLVEVIKTIDTSAATLEAVNGFVTKIGKTVVSTQDSPGFVVNLLLVPFILDAVRALEKGVATKEDIDAGMKLGCGHPMGPIELLDFVGLDTTLFIAEIMYDEFKDARYAAPPLLRRLVASGRFGRKNGRGFYDYGGRPAERRLPAFQTEVAGMMVGSLVFIVAAAAANDADWKKLDVKVEAPRSYFSVGEVVTANLVLANRSDAAVSGIGRADLVRHLYVAGPDRVGAHVTPKDEEGADPGPVTLLPGETFTKTIRFDTPATMKGEGSYSLAWVAKSGDETVSSNEVEIHRFKSDKPVAALETDMGTIVVELWPQKAENHVMNFITLAKQGFYDGVLFHRVMRNFMIQTGDPEGSDKGGPGYTIDAEFNAESFTKGVLGMARSDDPNSAGSQFFVMVGDNPDLNGKYTAFGRVLFGQEVADQISQVPPVPQANGEMSRPKDPVKLRKVVLTLPEKFEMKPLRKKMKG